MSGVTAVVPLFRYKSWFPKVRKDEYSGVRLERSVAAHIQHPLSSYASGGYSMPVFLGDVVYLASNDSKPYIGVVNRLFVHKRTRKKCVEIQWFYRQEDVPGQAAGYAPVRANEVLLSAYTDVNDVDTIVGRCIMLDRPIDPTPDPAHGNLYCTRYFPSMKPLKRKDRKRIRFWPWQDDDLVRNDPTPPTSRSDDPQPDADGSRAESSSIKRESASDIGAMEPFATSSADSQVFVRTVAGRNQGPRAIAPKAADATHRSQQRDDHASDPSNSPLMASSQDHGGEATAKHTADDADGGIHAAGKVTSAGPGDEANSVKRPDEPDEQSTATTNQILRIDPLRRSLRTPTGCEGSQPTPDSCSASSESEHENAADSYLEPAHRASSTQASPSATPSAHASGVNRSQELPQEPIASKSHGWCPMAAEQQRQTRIGRQYQADIPPLTVPPSAGTPDLRDTVVHDISSTCTSELWTAVEHLEFLRAMTKDGKDFAAAARRIGSKSVGAVVAHYYDAKPSARKYRSSFTTEQAPRIPDGQKDEDAAAAAGTLSRSGRRRLQSVKAFDTDRSLTGGVPYCCQCGHNRPAVVVCANTECKSPTTCHHCWKRSKRYFKGRDTYPTIDFATYNLFWCCLQCFPSPVPRPKPSSKQLTSSSVGSSSSSSSSSSNAAAAHRAEKRKRSSHDVPSQVTDTSLRTAGRQFLHTVLHELRGDVTRLRRISVALRRYHHGKISRADLISQIRRALSERPDLQMEFFKFLAPSVAAKVVPAWAAQTYR